MSRFSDPKWMNEPSNDPEVRVVWRYKGCGHEEEDWIQPQYLKNYEKYSGNKDGYYSRLRLCSACHSQRVRNGWLPKY